MSDTLIGARGLWVYALVDIQNDYFPGGCWPVDGMLAAAQSAAHLLGVFRQNGRLVVHVRHEMQTHDVPFFATGSKGAQIHPLVKPEAVEPIILKHRPNSFVGTDLLKTLQGAQIDHLVICGAMSQMCIDATTRGVVDLGFRASIVADACAAKSVAHNGLTVPAPQVHATITGALSGTYAQITKTQDY